MTLRIAVLGAGAMGSWFGGKLSQHGCKVQLLTTNAAHREAINHDVLIMREHNKETHVSVKALHPSNVNFPVDLFLLFTKAFQSQDAMASIAHAIDENTHVLSMQNGLGNAEAIEEQVPINNVWVGVSMMTIDKIKPGVVAGKGTGISYFGNACGRDDQPMAKKIANAFAPTGIALEHVNNVHERIWEKVAFNAGMNALSALSHGRPATIGQSPGARALAENVAKEVSQVAKSQKIDIDIKNVLSMIELSCTQHGDHIPSMLQDLLAKRKTEVDALNGAVVNAANKAGMAAPLNEMLATLVRLAELSHQTYDYA